MSTTDSKHNYSVAENLVNRKFSSEKPNQVWVTEITYLKSKAGWLYLTIFVDLFSRIVVGWSLSDNLGHESVVRALQRGIWRRKPTKD